MNLVRRYVRRQANRPDEQPFTDSHLHAVVWNANGQIHPVASNSLVHIPKSPDPIIVPDDEMATLE
jgi:hypothetical protein